MGHVTVYQIILKRKPFVWVLLLLVIRFELECHKTCK